MISANGRYVVFYNRETLGGDPLQRYEIYRHDVTLNQTITVSAPAAGGDSNGDSLYPAMSSDGRFVVFSSSANNLVSSDTNNVADIFVKDMDTGTIRRVEQTESNEGSHYPSISGDGRYVTFESTTGGYSNSFECDLQTGVIRRLNPIGTQSWAVISSDGQTIAYKANKDIFVYDRVSDKSTLLPKVSGLEGKWLGEKIALSADGRFVVYSLQLSTVAENPLPFLRVFLYDRLTNVTSEVSPASSAESNEVGSISGSGSRIVYPAFFLNQDYDKNATGIDLVENSAASIVDQCPQDPAKLSPGICGCGYKETDSDSDGKPDCTDPTKKTVPENATATKSGKKVTVKMQRFMGTGIKYLVFIQKAGSTRIQSQVTSKNSLVFRNMGKGTYKAWYQIKKGTLLTKKSKTVKFTL